MIANTGMKNNGLKDDEFNAKQSSHRCINKG
jgi:hypothetical protein